LERSDKVYGRLYILLLFEPLSIVSFTSPNSPEVKSQCRIPLLKSGFRSFLDDRVIHIPAKLGMGMAEDQTSFKREGLLNP